MLNYDNSDSILLFLQLVSKLEKRVLKILLQLSRFYLKLNNYNSLNNKFIVSRDINWITCRI